MKEFSIWRFAALLATTILAAHAGSLSAQTLSPTFNTSWVGDSFVNRDGNAWVPKYFELRLYSVTSNKLFGVLERFRDTVEPARRKHAITTVGYWTAGTTNGDKFIYLLAAPNKTDLKEREEQFSADTDFKSGYAASTAKYGQTVDKIVSFPLNAEPDSNYDFASSKTPRAFELRIYSLSPGKLDAFRNRWRDHVVPIYKRHGLRNIGWWVVSEKDVEGYNMFVCLLAGDTIDANQRSVGEFHEDPELRNIEQETEANGRFGSHVAAYKLVPVDFSPLK